jgi:hypothetical protein
MSLAQQSYLTPCPLSASILDGEEVVSASRSVPSACSVIPFFAPKLDGFALIKSSFTDPASGQGYFSWLMVDERVGFAVSFGVLLFDGETSFRTTCICLLSVRI